MFSETGNKKKFSSRVQNLMEFGSHTELETLIGKGVRPQDVVDSDKTTLLHLSSKYNNVKMMKYLIEQGCSVNVKNFYGMTPLMFAVMSNRLEAAQFLLNNNAGIYVENSYGKTVLHMVDKAATNVKLPLLKCIVEKLKKSGVEIEEIAKSLQDTKCSLANLICIHDVELTRVFLERNSLGPRDSYDCVHNALMSGKMHQVTTLLTHGPFFKRRRVYFLRWLMSMIIRPKAGSLELVETFARQILHWNILGKNEVSIIEHILKRVNAESVKILLRTGIVSHVKSCTDRDILMYVFGNPNPGIVDLLENENFDLNARGFNGQSALHIAVQSKLVKNVEFLLKKGADPNVKDDDGESPMFEALWSPNYPHLNVKCVELLLLHGADVQAFDYGGVSFIYYAARTDMMSDLLELVLAHFALREAMDLPVDQLILEQIHLRERSRKVMEVCREQLEEMKAHQISHKLTMFTIITKSIEVVSRCANGTDLKSTHKFLDEQKKFNKFFVNILKDRLSKVVKMNELKCKATDALFNSIQTLKPYDLVIDNIVKYFSFKDLIMFE